MTRSEFKKCLCAHGFVFSHNPTCGDRFTRVDQGNKQHVSRDSVRGSAWRLFLAVGEVPEIWPAVEVPRVPSAIWIDAESPWFNYCADLDPSDPLDAQLDNRAVALEKCFVWLIT